MNKTSTTRKHPCGPRQNSLPDTDDKSEFGDSPNTYYDQFEYPDFARFSGSPRTPPGSYSTDMNKYTSSHYLNEDLQNEDFSDLFKSVSSRDEHALRNMNEILTINARYPTLEVQSIMINPHLLLQFVASMTMNFILCSNSFMFTLINNQNQSHPDVVVVYIVSKLINLSCIGLISYIFTSPDTYKSVHVTLEYLAVNMIVYKYNFTNILKYTFVYLFTSVLAAFLSVAVYYDLLLNISTKKLLSGTFSSNRSYVLSYSYILISLLMHLFMAVGLTVISNTTTSTNSTTKAIHKAILTVFISITFGVVIGPIGYILPRLSLYYVIVLVRNDYSVFDINLFITYLAALLSIIIFYPIVVIQIKFIWRNRYRRYIEYGFQ